MTPTTPLPEPTSIAHTFTPFGAYHATVALACTVLVVAVCLLARRDGGRNETRVRTAWVWSIALLQSIMVVWFLLPQNFVLEESLPLHLCDLSGWLAAIALGTQRRGCRAVLYFWAIGLSSQAFITPVLDEGYASPKFWFFWLGHTQIVGSAVYDLWVLRFRPGWRDYRIAILAGVVYTLAMVGFNEVFKTNYGYVGRTLPQKKTILNALPPWPWRVLTLAGIAIVVQFVVLIPWLLVARFSAAPASPADPAPGASG